MPTLQVNSGTRLVQRTAKPSVDAFMSWIDVRASDEIGWRATVASRRAREFPDHGSESFGRIPWRAPSACGSSTGRRHSDFQRSRLDGSNEAHRGARTRPRHLQPGPGRPGRSWLANHDCWPSASGFDRGADVSQSRSGGDRRGCVLAFHRAIGFADRGQPAPSSPRASVRKKSGAARGLDAPTSAA
jgi:hypothetical protein